MRAVNSRRSCVLNMLHHGEKVFKCFFFFEPEENEKQVETTGPSFSDVTGSKTLFLELLVISSFTRLSKHS